jgi:hypothetical protein
MSGPGRPRQIEGHVQRKARLQAASILERRLSLPAPACPVSPDGARHTLTVFSLLPRCHGLAGWAKYTPSAKWTATRSWQAISEPWSQVKVSRARSGTAAITVCRASQTCSALWPAGRCTSLR